MIIKPESHDTARRIKAVIVGSYSPGSEVVGLDEARTVVLPHRMSGRYSFTPASCHCVGGQYHCESSSRLSEVQREVEDLTGSRLIVASAAYSAAAVAVPGTTVNAQTLADNDALYAANDAKRKACEQKGDPDFEELMKP